jgi:hypothetical protein
MDLNRVVVRANDAGVVRAVPSASLLPVEKRLEIEQLGLDPMEQARRRTTLDRRGESLDLPFLEPQLVLEAPLEVSTEATEAGEQSRNRARRSHIEEPWCLLLFSGGERFEISIPHLSPEIGPIAAGRAEHREMDITVT